MAEAIARRPKGGESGQAETQAMADARTRVDAALAAHAGSVIAAMELLQALQERGLLDLARGMATQSDELLGVFAGLLAKPEYANGIKSAFALLQGLGRMESEVLAEFAGAAAAGLREARTAAENGHSLGLFELLALLRDPDISAAVTAGLAFLKGMGAALRGNAGDDTHA